MQDGVERVGQNIWEAGQIERQEDKQDGQSAYGVNKTEAAAGASAQAAYVLGRKLAQKHERLKKLESISEADPLNEISPETLSHNEAASYTVSVAVNPSDNQRYPLADKAVCTAEAALSNELNKPLAGHLIKVNEAAERIKEKKNKPDLPSEDKKTVRERPIYRVKPYIGATDISQEKSDNASVRQAPNRDIRTKTIALPKTIAVKYPNGFRQDVKPAAEAVAEKSPTKRELAAKRGIKTREAYRTTENPNAQAAAQFRLEQGRELAKKNCLPRSLTLRKIMWRY